MAAAGFGAAARVAARLQFRACPFVYLALSKHHGGFKLRLDLHDPVQQFLEVGPAHEGERVVLRRVGLQVKNKRGVVGLEDCEYWAVFVWGGPTVAGTWCTKMTNQESEPPDCYDSVIMLVVDISANISCHTTCVEVGLVLSQPESKQAIHFIGICGVEDHLLPLTLQKKR